NFGTKTIRNSSLSQAYYEEKLMRCMDSLNELYVALTRAKEHLYVNVIGENNPLQSFLAGDIIRYALRSFESETGKSVDFNSMVDPEKVKKEQPTESPEYWRLDFYPQGGHLKQQLDRTAYDRLAEQSVQQRIRKGTLVHHLLSKINDEFELD